MQPTLIFDIFLIDFCWNLPFFQMALERGGLGKFVDGVRERRLGKVCRWC